MSYMERMLNRNNCSSVRSGIPNGMNRDDFLFKVPYPVATARVERKEVNQENEVPALETEKKWKMTIRFMELMSAQSHVLPVEDTEAFFEQFDTNCMKRMYERKRMKVEASSTYAAQQSEMSYRPSARVDYVSASIRARNPLQQLSYDHRLNHNFVPPPNIPVRPPQQYCTNYEDDALENRAPSVLNDTIACRTRGALRRNQGVPHEGTRTRKQGSNNTGRSKQVLKKPVAEKKKAEIAKNRPMPSISNGINATSTPMVDTQYAKRKEAKISRKKKPTSQQAKPTSTVTVEHQVLNESDDSCIF